MPLCTITCMAHGHKKAKTHAFVSYITCMTHGHTWTHERWPLCTITCIPSVHVSWLMHLCHMTHSCVCVYMLVCVRVYVTRLVHVCWDSFMCAMNRISMCFILICVTRLMHIDTTATRAVTPCVCVPWLLHVCVCHDWHVCVYHDSCMCVCAMTDAYVQGNARIPTRRARERHSCCTSPHDARASQNLFCFGPQDSCCQSLSSVVEGVFAQCNVNPHTSRATVVCVCVCVCMCECVSMIFFQSRAASWDKLCTGTHTHTPKHARHIHTQLLNNYTTTHAW